MTQAEQLHLERTLDRAINSLRYQTYATSPIHSQKRDRDLRIFLEKLLGRSKLVEQPELLDFALAYIKTRLE